jgi:hypothetical protein
MIAAAVLASTVGMLLPLSGQADAPERGCAGDPETSDLAQGEGTIAIAQREVIVIGNKRRGCYYQRPASTTGLLKHVAVRTGVGTAYVDDEAGDDLLIAVTPRGVQHISTNGEATHPAWSPNGELVWAEDFRSLRLLAEGEDAPATIPAPSRVTGLFSPVFSTGRTITAVAQEPAGGFESLSEDDTLNNLWSYDGATRRWSRLTKFSVSGDRWSAIRTPVVAGDGSVLFVRVHGNYTATREPIFELWRHAGSRTQKLRTLPGEMYLAGFRNDRLMWNVYTRTCGDWELLVEDPGEGLVPLGCGAVMVDPVNLPDGDLLVEEHGKVASDGSEGSNAPVGVVVGDFEDRAEARAVARRIPGSVVLGHHAAPAAVGPGAFVVAVVVEGDPDGTLAMVKRHVPSLRDRVFLAPLGKV